MRTKTTAQLTRNATGVGKPRSFFRARMRRFSRRCRNAAGPTLISEEVELEANMLAELRTGVPSGIVTA